MPWTSIAPSRYSSLSLSSDHRRHLQIDMSERLEDFHRLKADYLRMLDVARQIVALSLESSGEPAVLWTPSKEIYKTRDNWAVRQRRDKCATRLSGLLKELAAIGTPKQLDEWSLKKYSNVFTPRSSFGSVRSRRD